MNKSNDLFDFIQTASNEIEEEYKRIQKRATEDPGTAGDQGEENWAELLRNWLPPTFQIVTKGRILSYEGNTSPQVDVIILHPDYPKHLLNKKLYLAGGVLAVFECKLTLKTKHIEEFLKHSVEIKKQLPSEKGSPYRELQSPIIYGLLAHSHSWKGNNSNPKKNIEDSLWEYDKKYITHPFQSPDLICVADLATWSVVKVAFMGPKQIPNYKDILPLCGPTGSATSTYLCFSKETLQQKASFTPIGSLLSRLIQKIAWGYPSLRGLARYYVSADVHGRGEGGIRVWENSIYSEKVKHRLQTEPFSYGQIGDEWSRVIL